MQCKCGYNLENIAAATGVATIKSVGHYCYSCGRLYLKFNEKNGQWLESEKSRDSSLISRMSIEKLINESFPKENVSLKNKGKYEILLEMKDKLFEIR